MTQWKLAGAQDVTITVEGARVVVEQSRAGGKRKTVEKVLADASEAQRHATAQVQQRVLEGLFDAALAPRRVPFDALASKLDIASNNEQADDPVLVFDGPTTLSHSLLLDYRQGLLARDVAAGILVEGDLVIEGDLLNFEDDFGPFLVVRGDLVCRSVATGGARIHVEGSVRTDVVVGVYNHGLVRIGGTLEARAVATEHTVEVRGRGPGADEGPPQLWYKGWGSKCFPRRPDGTLEEAEPYEPEGVFQKALLKNESVDLREARQRCASGKPVLLDAPVSVRDAFLKLVAKKLAAPEKVKSLSLSGKGLSILPPELFAFTALEKLDLTHNRLRTLPPEIGRLGKLRELVLRGNGLVELPAELGSCTELRRLDLEANCLTGLPDALAGCFQLHTVNLRNNPYSYVRRVFGGWDRVEFMEQLPEVLTRLPALTHLDVQDTLIRSMPSAPFASPSLGPVVLSDTLITEVDVARFPQFILEGNKGSDEGTPITQQALHAVAERWASAHVDFWFSTDGIDLDAIYEARPGAYDFDEVRALLTVLLRLLVPVAAPYGTALEKFEKRAKQLADRLRWDEARGEAHVRALFGALAEEVRLRAEELGAPALTEPLATMFLSLCQSSAA